VALSLEQERDSTRSHRVEANRYLMGGQKATMTLVSALPPCPFSTDCPARMRRFHLVTVAQGMQSLRASARPMSRTLPFQST
jgi:hypothetical protein